MAITGISSAKSHDIVFNHIIVKDICEKDYAMHYHDRCEMIFFIRGDAQYVAEGRSYKLGFGDVIISRPSVIHAIMPKASSDYERINFIIDEKLLPKTLWHRIKSGRDVFRCADNERITDLFAKLDFYYGKFEDEEYARLAFNIVEEVLLNLSITEGEEAQAGKNPLLEKALFYIRENLTEIVSVEEISKALYITKSHLHHLFSKNLKLTPAKYITQKRLMLAQKKIRRGGKPTVIFAECGFEDYATFFRNYKKHFGYSPAEQRNTEVGSTMTVTEL